MKRENISDNEALKSIDNALTQTDNQRLEELNRLQELQQVRDQVLLFEQKRLALKYGEDHPLVIKTNARLAYQEQMSPSLNFEISRAQTKTTPLPANAWRLNGKVFDLQNQPAQNLTVYFADEKKNWIRAYGSTCTDTSGYYALTVVADPAGTNQKQALYLAVADSKQQVLYIDSNPYFFADGIIEYKDVYLGDKENCVKPPDGSKPGTPPPPTKTNPTTSTNPTTDTGANPDTGSTDRKTGSKRRKTK